MKIGLIGFGEIGSSIAKAMKREICWVVDSNQEAKQKMRRAGLKCAFYPSIPKKCGRVDLVVEAASQEAVPLLLECLPFCDVMILSVGALANSGLRARVFSAAKKHRHKLYIPSGAVGGLDALFSASQGKIRSVTLETSKPPFALGRKDRKRTVVFSGSAKVACRKFPKSVNVAATLSLSGIGFEKTRVMIVSDPKVKRNTHRVFVESDSGRMEFVFENFASTGNPKTSALAALSAIARARKINSTLQIG